MTLRERLDKLPTVEWVGIRSVDGWRVVEVRQPDPIRPWLSRNCTTVGSFRAFPSALKRALEYAEGQNLYWIAHPVCYGCRQYYEPFMVQNTLWSAANLPFGRGSICWPCLEELVGRPFRLEDFTNTPINSNIRRAWRRGRDEGGTHETP